MKKKILSLMLAVVMMLSLSVTALAGVTDNGDGTYSYSDDTSITISKTYTLEGEGTSPAETFYLMQVGDGTVVTGDGSATALVELDDSNKPTVDSGNIVVASVSFTTGAASTSGTTENFEITLPSYSKVGVYKYTLQEVAGNTAGVTYYGTQFYLVVTVINGDDGNLRIAGVHTETTWNGETANNEGKSDGISNTYSAGSLEISKTVTGNLGDKSKYFAIKIKLTGETGKTYEDSYTITYTNTDSEELSALNLTNPTSISVDGEVTIYLKSGSSASIANLPYGVTYTVEEIDTAATGDDSEYDQSTVFSDEDKEIDSAKDTVAITNEKVGEVDTGISLDSLPYILMLIAVAAGVVVMISRRRLSNRF